MLLIIDNYDSFTYNLVQYFGELGADVHVHRNDALTLEQIAAWEPRQIVISPGPCTPNEAGISVPLIQRFAGRISAVGTNHRPVSPIGVVVAGRTSPLSGAVVVGGVVCEADDVWLCADPLVWAEAATLTISVATIAIATRFNIRTRLRDNPTLPQYYCPASTAPKSTTYAKVCN